MRQALMTAVKIETRTKPRGPGDDEAKAEEPMIQIEDLRLHYGDKPALKGITMQVPKNRVTAFIGPSGCGKTTLLRCLNRMNDLVDGVRITGRILVGGRDVYDGSMDVTELAAATFLLAPSLSRILPDMEQRQLVSRRQVDSDLRRSIVSLEPKGLGLIARHAPDSEEIYAEIAQRFGPERSTQLFTLLHDLEQSLEGLSRERDEKPERTGRKPLAQARKRSAGDR